MKKTYVVILAMGLLLAFGILPVMALDAPVGHWKLDEGSGTVVKDSSGNGFDGEAVGDPVWVAGKFDKALELNGTSNEVVIPDNDALDGMTQMTIAAWVNIAGQGNSAFPRILSKGHEDSWTFLIDIAAGNRLRFIVTNANGKIDVTGTTDLAPMFNEFHHCAAVWDGSEVVFYIDGAETHRAAAVGPVGVNTTQPVRIGNSPSGRYFQGIIDDVWLFNTALSDDDVALVMSGGATAVQPVSKLAVTWGGLKK